MNFFKFFISSILLLQAVFVPFTPVDLVVWGDTKTLGNNAPNSAYRWEPILEATWEGYKSHYIFCGQPCGNNLGLVFDPNTGYQAVSEGVGYGMLMAVMMGDQDTFNTIYEAANRILYDPNVGLYHWRSDNAGNIIGQGSATDADQDIATALIFAEGEVQRGHWEQRIPLSYGTAASDLIDSIWNHDVVDDRYLKPGDRFAGDGQGITNPSYFSPAWYRIYDAFQSTNRWQGVIDQGYETLYQNEGAALGLAPDWSTADGQRVEEFCEIVPAVYDDCGYSMSYDAIRVQWRIAVDCLWFRESRACEWNQRGVAFMETLPNYQFARMYDMSGNVIVNYQDEAMLGMWLTMSLGARNTSMTSRIENTLSQYTQNAVSQKYWGASSNYYFNQSLVWFGISLRTRTFRNLCSQC